MHSLSLQEGESETGDEEWKEVRNGKKRLRWCRLFEEEKERN